MIPWYFAVIGASFCFYLGYCIQKSGYLVKWQIQHDLDSELSRVQAEFDNCSNSDYDTLFKTIKLSDLASQMVGLTTAIDIVKDSKW